MLTVRDPWGRDSDSAYVEEEAGEQPLTAELGFLMHEKTGAADEADHTVYASMGKILADDACSGVRFDAMRTAARLSKHCEELTDILRRGADSTRVTMEALPPLVFKALPALRL